MLAGKFDEMILDRHLNFRLLHLYDYSFRLILNDEDVEGAFLPIEIEFDEKIFGKSFTKIQNSKETSIPSWKAEPSVINKLLPILHEYNDFLKWLLQT